MPPPMLDMSFAQPMMAPMMVGSMTPGVPPHFATISDGTTAAATTFNNPGGATSEGQGTFLQDEDLRKAKARIELLEKKIRAKDQLFEDALASTMAGSFAGGSSSMESRTLTSELKKRVLELKTKHKEAEDEIDRLTKTVKVVEVEVKEDSEPLHRRIQELEDQNYEFQQEISS